ncbi:MAG: ABC transporter permease [Gemmatimonadaceae bacterium]
MAKLWAVMRREYLERVRTKWFLVATFLGPIFFGALIVVPTVLAARSRASSDVANIVILDATGTQLAGRVAAQLVNPMSDTGLTEIRTVEPETLARAESLVTDEVMREEAQGYLVLDDQTIAGQTARYAGRNASSLPDMERIETAVRQAVMALRLEREGLDRAQIEELTTMRLQMTSERITDRGRGGSGMMSFFFAFGVAFFLYMSIILYGQNILRGVMEEKQTRVAEVVLSSVRSETLLAGKVLGVGGVGLTQIIIWAVSGIAMYRLREPLLDRFGVASPPLQLPDITLAVGALLILFFVLGFTFYAALFAAVGAMVNNDQDAQQAAMPVMLLIVASAIFMQPVLLNPSGTMAQVMTILPFSAPILMPMRLSMVPVPPLEIVASIVALILACIAAVWLASRIYRVGLLMYGKRPTVRELARWVRYSG